MTPGVPGGAPGCDHPRRTERHATAPMNEADLPFSPAAERNCGPILEVLQAWLPADSTVLELASGTGQHARHFATAPSGWTWQPTELQTEALGVLALRCAGLSNVQPPLRLDVTAEPWPVDAAAFDAVFAANLLHISPWAATLATMRGAARCLRPAGALLLYGPFIVPGEPLAPSNAAFDADLRMRDAAWGLRSLADVEVAAAAAGLTLAERRAMPANNLMLRFTVVR